MRRGIAVLAALMVLCLVASPVAAGKPKIDFKAHLTADGVKLPGSIDGHFKLVITGIPSDPRQTLGVTDVKAKPDLAVGMYPFYLDAGLTQRLALRDYFFTKWGPGDYLTQIYAEIDGYSDVPGNDAAFFYLDYDGANYSLIDGFTWALSHHLQKSPLVIDNDYPVGRYTYVGTLTGENGATLALEVKLEVKLQK